MEKIKDAKMSEVDFVCYVRTYAMENYTNGWDSIVECYGYDDISAFFNEYKGNAKKAFKALKDSVEIYNDYANEIKATAW